MEQNTSFSYTYSAKENAEVLEIRKKYLLKEESKFEEMKRLDDLVQSAGTTAALSLGIGGTMLMGLGLCLALEVIAVGAMAQVLGSFLGLVGVVDVSLAYPVHQKATQKAKKVYAARILELAADLSHESVRTEI